MINPVSGGGKAKKVVDLIHHYFQPPEYDYQISYTQPNNKNITIAKDSKMVIAVGGDGTINKVASQLLSLQIPLGIIPMGSGNGLARHLGIPMDPLKAMAIIKKGGTTRIDVGKINNEIFLCAAGIGFDATVADRFSKSKQRGLLNYLKIGMLLFFRYKSKKYHLLIDDQSVERKAFVIVFANASQYGNNAVVAANADIRDGLLNICLIKNVTWLNVSLLLASLFLKKLHTLPNVICYVGKKIVLKNTSVEKMHRDGEIMEVQNDVKISIEPGKLEIIVGN